MQFSAVALSLVLCGCGGDKKQGALGADCYPNGTCNVTLACVGGLCVAPMDAANDTAMDAVRTDGAVDAPPDGHNNPMPDAYCDAVSTATGDGHHNAGQTCLQVGCHLTGNTGAGAPEYSIAGTLYQDAGGGSAFAGATIELTIGSQVHKVITASNGNFFLPPALAAAPTAAMPGSALASACPDTVMMVGQLVDNGGNCNNCHRTGGTTTPMHVP
jgi:hypothetical protein